MRKKHKDQAHRLRVLTGKEKENEPNGFCSLLMSRCPEATGDDTEYCKTKCKLGRLAVEDKKRGDELDRQHPYKY